MLARRVTAPNLLWPHASPLADLSSGSLAIFAAIRRASSLRLEQSMGGGVFSKDEQGTFLV